MLFYDNTLLFLPVPDIPCTANIAAVKLDLLKMDLNNLNGFSNSTSINSGSVNLPSSFHSVLLDLKQMDKRDLHAFMKKVLYTVANALDIERVSIWFFDEGRTSIYCDYLYLKKFGEYVNETTLSVTDFPEYFKAIETSLFIAAEDARNDKSTKELSEKYLEPRGIHSMLDIPIYYNNEIIGIICHEEQDKIRKWKREEIDFTAAISTLISTSLEIDFSRNKEKDFLENRRFLSTLISNLPGYVYRVVKEGDVWSIQYISDGVYDLTGHKPDELVKNKVLYYAMMVNETDKAAGKEIISKALAEKKPYQINYRISTAGGNIKWVWEQGRGVYNENNELIATEGFITDITDKKIFEEEILRKNNELSALYHFSRTLSKLNEPGILLEDIGNMLVKFFDRENVYIALYDENNSLITYPYFYQNRKLENISPRPFGTDFTEFIIKSRKSLIINENLKESLKGLDINILDFEAKSLIAAPIITGDKVLGVIVIQDYREENSFTAGQLDFLTTVSAQAAIALENAFLYEEVTRSLKEKEMLLQEVHHRVKNNLQVISSLIKLQTRYINEERMLEILKETGSRIQSMAIVHTKIYNSKDYEFINFGEYTKNLIENFQGNYSYRLRKVQFVINIDSIKLNIDTAIPCGLILNELLSNAVKYAFSENTEGIIEISLKNTEARKFTLNVKDNGTGTDDTGKITKSDSLGMQLVKLLTKQLNGELNVYSEPGKGVEFKIDFEEAVYKSRK